MEATDPRPISIWQPGRHAGEAAFVRPPPLPLGDHYADRVAVTAAKPAGTLRICLFGESVAAGYLYAPHVTPAKLLQRRLATGGGAVDVVDLARTNERLDTMVETIAAAMQLDPDVLVVFAGNNWTLLETPEVSPYHQSAAALRDYGGALAADGPMGPIELAARRKLERSAAALDRIAALARGRAAVVLVVPEVNLADWESRQPVTWLPGDGTARWHELRGGAVAALAAGERDAARTGAEQMIDLDGATGPTGFHLLARAVPGGGGAAHAAAEAAVAADHYATLAFISAPRATRMDQELLRRVGARHGFPVVDLPAAFRAEGGIPDRRWFLDYCHFTAAGMEVAMTAVARAVAALTGGAAPERSLGDGPQADVVATARLGAAIHTAHRMLPAGPDPDLVAHWLRQALDASPTLETTLLDLVEARAAPVPEVLTAAQVRNQGSPHRLGFAHGWRYPHLDAVLVDAIGAVLAERGRPRSETVDPILRRCAPGDPVELVAPPRYLWEPAARFHPDVVDYADVTRTAFLRCPWPETSLGFVAGDPGSREASVTLRLPTLAGVAARGGEVGLSVNGQPVAQVPASERWTTTPVRIPARAGLNRLDLAWPRLPPVGTEMLAAAADRLQRGLAADIHPVFGEVWSVQVG